MNTIYKMWWTIFQKYEPIFKIMNKIQMSWTNFKNHELIFNISWTIFQKHEPIYKNPERIYIIQ